MPPKKKGDEEKPPPMMGRMKTTNLKIGIVGLPNVGKSTFFNCMTKSMAKAENFPFCTIDPNESRVPVPDKRWDFLCDTYKPASKVPAFLNVVDIAGLVAGASEGKGLGNAFLSHISACDGIFHVVRAFSDEDIVHVEGDVDPSRDLEIIHNELRAKDEAYLKDRLAPMERSVGRGGGDKKKKEEYDVLKKVEELLANKKCVRQVIWDAKEIEILNEHLFLTSKPVIYLVNLSEKDYLRKKNKWLIKIKEWLDANDKGATVILMSCALEQELLDQPTQEERDAILKEKATTSALDKIIVTGYKTLGLIYFFTAGEDEVKAWTIQNGAVAPVAAGRIHSDMEKGFIKAEIMGYDDFAEYQSEAEVKAHGKYMTKGKDYVVKDGDIIYFQFNAGAGLTAAKKK